MTKPTLILVGCSWFCGEWNYSQDGVGKITHPGLSEYLSDNFHVVNLSRAGASNWQTLYTLTTYLQVNIPNNPRLTEFCVIIGQTDPMRIDACEYYHVDYLDISKRASSITQMCQELLGIFYIHLSNLAKQFQFKPYLVGGLTDVDLSQANRHCDQIEVLIPSWIQLLNSGHQPSACPLMWGSRQWEIVRAYDCMNILSSMMDLCDSNFLHAQTLLETDWFGPTFGDFHPSRRAHRLLADKILELLKNR